MNASALAVALLAMLAVGGLAYALVYPALSGEKRAEKRRKEFAGPSTIRSVDRDAIARTKRGQVAQSLKELESREKARHKLTLETRIAQAGLSWTRRSYYIFSLSASAGTGFLLWLASGNAVLGATGLFIGGLGVPAWFLRHCKIKRLKKFGAAFPDALDVIVRGIKAGLPVNDCMRIVASEANEPVRSEFRQIIEAQALGLSLAEACGKLYDRMPCAEANFFGIVIAIQQKTGGNLSETIANLSRVLRERRKMRDKIQAVSMEAKASAAIIGALPPTVSFLVYMTSPRYIELLWLTQAGKLALVCCAIWMTIGVLIMRKMINFEI